MSNEETITCWACDTSISKLSTVCPNCDMPLTDSSEEIEDIDSLLDDLSVKTSEIEDTLPDIPSYGEDIPATPSFDEKIPDTPEFSMDTDENQATQDDLSSDSEIPIIPSFEDEAFTKSDLDTELFQQNNQSQESTQKLRTPATEVEPKESPDAEITDFGDDEFPAIPTFDDDSILKEDKIDDEDLIMREIVSLSELSNKQKMRIFVPQLTYWSLVFIIISLAGIQVENSNFDLENFNSDYYSIKAEFFLFGWISFLPMGWFYRHKLNQYNVKESMVNGVIYLILQFLYLTIVSVILFLIVNPNAQLLSIADTDTSTTTIMTTYVYFSLLGFIMTGLTFGFLLFFVGYKYYFNKIYKITPLSEITN